MFFRQRSVVAALTLAATVLCVSAQAPGGNHPNELNWSLKYDPKTLDPAKVDDQASELVRFLTAGVLLRMNRRTQGVEPALAANWTLSPDGKLATFQLRRGLRFSDGMPLSSKDVAATLKRVLDPATGAPVAAEFLSPAEVRVETPDPLTVKLFLPKRIASVGKVVEEIAIEPANRRPESRVCAGPFVLDDYRRGEFLTLRRNPHYWKHDAAGVQLPYLDSIRLDILSNREQDQMRFLRGQYGLIDNLPAENIGFLARSRSQSLHDLGPSLNTEQMWFNQSPDAPLPAWEKQWFQSRVFRVAVSRAIHRAELVRVAYNGRATPANGFISPANTVWHDAHLPPIREDSNAALQMLLKEGFRKNGAVLVDAQGHPVKFSILTNGGNRSREKMAELIQHDLAALGMQVSVQTLEFPALMEKVMHTRAYEAALLGLANVDPDPSSMMNVWMSSSPDHEWNPSEKKPATEWEAEIDRLMELQASTGNRRERQRAVNRVQEILGEEQPFVYLVYPNVLYAVSPALSGVELTVLQPGVVSNIDLMRWKDAAR